ncbi:efflux RND transporter periplasmic adaptor subunit [Paenibacillus sp. TH7-28]
MLKRGLQLTLIGTLLVTSSACSSADSEEAGASVQKVTTMKVEMVPVAGSLNLSGTLEAYKDVSVAFELSGIVEMANVEVGDSVVENQLLSQLDSSSYQLQLEKANTSLSQAAAGIKNAKAVLSSAGASITSAEAQMSSATASLNQLLKGARQQQIAQAQTQVDRAQAALAKAQTDADRIQSLYTEGLASLNEWEQAQLASTNASKNFDDAQNALSLLEEGATEEELESAQAAVRQAQSAKQSAVAAREQAQAALEQASSQREQALVAKKEAELALAKTALKSPISGTVLAKNVTAEELAAAGQPAYTIGQIDKLKILLPVPDHDIENWETGQKVKLSQYNQTREGMVHRIYPTTNTNTGSINVEVIVDNADRDWTPGQVVKAGLLTEQSKQIVIPAQAVLSNGNETYVFKVVNQKAVKTAVKVGDLIENQLEIIDGLSVGDQIVTIGANLIYDGLNLQYVEEETK